MKLVTGIEAIQSGKPWKHKDNDEWIEPNSCTYLLTPYALQAKVYIIKEEPREFWLNMLTGTIHTEIPFNIDICEDNWIRVREVEQ